MTRAGSNTSPLLGLVMLLGAITVQAQQAPAATPRPSPARPAASAPRPAPLPANASKPELVARLIQLQQGLAVGVARGLVDQPLMQMQQAAAVAIQQRFPPEARESAMKDVQAEARKFADDASPILRDALQRHAAPTLGAVIDERFNEDELKQLIAILESPVLRKYEQVVPELQRALQEKLLADARGRLAERARLLEQAVRKRVEAGPGPAASAPATTAAPPASPAAPAPGGTRRP